MKQIKSVNIPSNYHPPSHEYFMEKVISIAHDTLKLGNFPVGCVIEYKGSIMAEGTRTGTNRGKNNEIDHAEMNALKKLTLHDEGYDRSLMTLYCNLEPCLMCFGAILLSGINNIVFAYEDIMGGGTSCNIFKLPSLYSNIVLKIIPGVLRDRSLKLFKSFFANSRNSYLINSELCTYTKSQPTPID